MNKETRCTTKDESLPKCPAEVLLLPDMLCDVVRWICWNAKLAGLSIVYVSDRLVLLTVFHNECR